MHVIEGEPGTGKTTLGLQFSCAGVAAGERVLYVSFSETVEELREIAGSHELAIDGVDLRYLSVGSDAASDSPQSMLDPGELFLPRIAETLRETLQKERPNRVVIDSLADMRLVAQDLALFRTQLLQLRELLARGDRVTLMLDSMTEYSRHLRTISSGIVLLEQTSGVFGPVRRQLSILKMRARAHATGRYDFQISKGGIEVYTRLRAPVPAETELEPISSGVEEVDALFGGGLERGSSVLLLGPAGIGKSILATQYAAAAAARGERTSVYLFDERRNTYISRSRGVGLDVEGPLEAGTFHLRRVDPGEMSPGEFASGVRDEVESHGTRVVVIDSLSGYVHAMPDARFVELHLHEMLTYLARNRVLALLILSEHGPFATRSESNLDLSYLADTVLLLRYFEYSGEMRRALSVYKKRSGNHERLLREIRVGAGGIEVGEPLRKFRGVLTGVPEYLGEELSSSSP